MDILTKALESTGNNQSELARQIGVRVSLLNDMLRNRRPVPAWVASRAAEIVGTDPAAAELEALAANARSEAERAHWLHRLEGIGRTAAAVAVVGFLGLSGDSMSSHAAGNGDRTSHSIHSAYY